MENWCKKNKQALNAGKSKLLIFHRKDLIINDSLLYIERVKSLKILGVVLNENLT